MTWQTDNMKWLDGKREEGWAYTVTTPTDVDPEDAEAAGFETLSVATTLGFRTWLFKSKQEAMDFRGWSKSGSVRYDG